MAKKVSKNSRVAQRAGNVGSGKDFVKVVKSVKDPVKGTYSFKEAMIHKDLVQEFLKK
jgi:pyruvate/oxaloacetate carboxyltransferase